MPLSLRWPAVTLTFDLQNLIRSSVGTVWLVNTPCKFYETAQNLSQPFHLKGVKTCFFILSACPAVTAVRYIATGHTSAFISRIFVEIGIL